MCAGKAKKRDRGNSLSPLKANDPIRLDLTFMTSSKLNYILKVLFAKTVTLGLGLQLMNLMGDIMQFIVCPEPTRNLGAGGLLILT